MCSAAAAAAGSTGHDGSGNDSLPSPHNQSPILIYVCPCPSVRPYVRPSVRLLFDVGTCRARSLALRLFTPANLP